MFPKLAIYVLRAQIWPLLWEKEILLYEFLNNLSSASMIICDRTYKVFPTNTILTTVKMLIAFKNNSSKK